VALWIISTGCYSKFELTSLLTNESCLTIHSTMQSPVLWLDLQIIQCAANSNTEGSRKDRLTSLPRFHISEGLPDLQTSSQVLQATMYVHLSLPLKLCKLFKAIRCATRTHLRVPGYWFPSSSTDIQDPSQFSISIISYL